MPSTPYDLVKDDYDLRVPLHAEQAFFRGIVFQAKLLTHTIKFWDGFSFYTHH